MGLSNQNETFTVTTPSSLPNWDFSLTGSIGNTPLVELKHVNPNPAVRLLAKLEGNNPGGSVKDGSKHHDCGCILDPGLRKSGFRQ